MSWRNHLLHTAATTPPPVPLPALWLPDPEDTAAAVVGSSAVTMKNTYTICGDMILYCFICVILYMYTLLYFIMLCCVILYFIMLCCVVLYYIIHIYRIDIKSVCVCARVCRSQKLPCENSRSREP